MSDRDSTPPSGTTVYKLRDTTADVRPPALPPSSVTQKSYTTRVDDGPAANEPHEQRPFSPLTLSELGLLPPSTPSALLDISAPISLALSGGSKTAESLDGPKVCPPEDKIADESKADDKDVTEDVDAQRNPALEGRACGKLLEMPAFTASPTAYHDPFLTSFLQSLSDEPVELAGQCSSNDTQSRAGVPDGIISTRGSEPSQLVSQKASKDIAETKSVTTNALARRQLDKTHKTESRHLHRSSTSASNRSNPFWENHQLSRSEVQTSVEKAISQYKPGLKENAIVGESYDKAAPSLTTLLPFEPHHLRVTSTPLERAQPLAVTGAGQHGTSSASSTATTCSLAQAVAPNDLLRTTWPPQLANLSHFTLPQPLPLQPEHRYPIQILETDGRYEPDFETDRESESGLRTGVSPSRSDSLSSVSASKRRVAAKVVRKSRDWSRSDDASRCAAKPLSRSTDSIIPAAAVSCASSSMSQGRGEQTLGSAADAAEISNPFKRVPLSNVVRSGSWSSASHSCSGTYGGGVFHVQSTDGKHAEPSSCLCTVTPSSELREERTRNAGKDADLVRPTGQTAGTRPTMHSTSATTSASRRSSHDFTRQALLDFIRRTNLGIENNAVPGDSATPAASKPTTTSETSAFAHEAESKAPWASSSWSSSVPAELQTHLQNWQEQRKRQKTLSEVLSVSDKASFPESASASTLTGRSATADCSWASERVEEQPRRTSKRNLLESEQERKSKKQEHYQRLLLQLQAQMRMKMQMQKQKQTGMHETLQPKGASIRKEGLDSTVQTGTPSPPVESSSGSRRGSTNNTEDPTATRAALNGDKISAARPSATSNSYDDKGKSAGGSDLNQSTKASVDSSGEGELRRDQVSRAGFTPPPSRKARTFSHLGMTWPAFVDLITLKPTSDHNPTDGKQDPQCGPVYWPAFSDRLYEQQPEGFASAQRRSQPAFQSGFGDGNVFGHSPLLARTWKPISGFSALSPWNSSHTTELMVKHHNWLRDMETTSPAPAVTTGSSISNIRTRIPWQSGEPSLSLSTASMPLLQTTMKPPVPRVHGPQQTPTTASSSIKRPFSPGAEVVFWAVKGEHSVKLVGTVESVSTIHNALHLKYQTHEL